jgi:hypothetical protein
MQAHRFRHLLEPQAATAPVAVVDAAPAGFVACPPALISTMPQDRRAWTAELYRVALDQARRQVQPSLFERARSIHWN